jgi:uncharacterized membrane protein YhhN
MKKSLFPILFLLATTANLAGHLLEISQLADISKVALMPILILWVFASKPKERHMKAFLPIALFFSWLGDIFLIFDHLFIPGLGSFLIAQVLYAIVFFRSVGGKLYQPTLRIIPYLFYGAMFFYVMLPEAGNLKVPIILYGLTLLIMGFLSLTRQSQASNVSFLLVVMGSTLFIVSDSLIAVGMFLNRLPYHSFWVMSTYAVAQLLIVQGLLKDQST